MRTGMRGRGNKQLPASSPGQDLGSEPSPCSHQVVCRGTNTPKSHRACLPTATHLPILGKCCWQSPTRGAGAELQPLWTGLLPLLSRSCFVCKPSARRPTVPAAARGPRWTGLFENSLKRSTQAQRLHMPKGRPALRAVARPSLLPPSLLGSALPRAQCAPSPAESLQAFPEASSFSRAHLVHAQSGQKEVGAPGQPPVCTPCTAGPASCGLKDQVLHSLKISQAGFGVRRGRWRR